MERGRPRRRVGEARRPKVEEFLTAVLDAVGALVVVLDRGGRVVHWNRACEVTTGYRFDEIAGVVFWEKLLLQEEIETVKGVFRQLRSGMFPNTHENYWVAKDGSRRLIAWSNTALLGRNGEVENVIGTGIDITREQELTRKVRVTTHLASLAGMAAGITHEINNPLNAAHLHLTLLKRRLSRMDGPDARSAIEAAEAVSKEIQRVSALARDFLSFSRPPALQRSRLDLAAVVEEMVSLCRPEAEAAGVRLSLEGSDAVPVSIDLGRVKQVILNLTRNAIEASGQGGRVRVAVSRRRDEAILEVEDDGPGLPAPYETVVEPFFTTKPHGTGLGLAVTHRIVADHGGSVSVDSRPGRTLFVVALPDEAGSPG